MKIEATKLYRSLCKDVRKQDHKELLRMLQFLRDSQVRVNWNEDDLGFAFIWRDSPQGIDYWNALYLAIELRRMGV